jgi:hypothetical protein
MTGQARDWVAACLRDPGIVPGLLAADWDTLIRQAAAADLTARLALTLKARGLLDAVPPAPRRHLEASITYAQTQHDGVRREIAYIADALAETGVRPVLLKGAAYVAAQNHAALGRMFVDIDILVPRAKIGEVEAALMLKGWITTHADAYDQKYYREWMHEIPPMLHIHRGTTLDAHHSILPLTGRLQPRADLLLAHSSPVESDSRLAVLDAAEMVLHSATHLFMNEEFSHGLRDLSDLDLLMRQFGRTDEFWGRLVAQARVHGVARLLLYALAHTRRVLGTPVPAGTLAALEADAPPPLLAWLMHELWATVLCSPHASLAGGRTVVAGFLLYLRAHWMRMPFPMLVRHLATKAWMGMRKSDAGE